MKRLLNFLLFLLLSASITFAQNRAGNKGAGIPPEVLNTYEALDFNGMPYRFLLPNNYDPKQKYPLILNLH